MAGPKQKTILAGKYRLVRQLGRGGMGSVWYAEHLTLQAPVAIKLIDPDVAANPDTLLRFLQEAKAAAALRSPHVVQVFDHGVDDGTPYIVMELLEGESLGDRLEQGKLSPAETAQMITQVGRALTRAHDAGIIHRDLKPENIFLVRNDEEPVAKILDFGIAKTTASSLVLSQVVGTRSGVVMGTPVYMSPEQAEGSRTLDQRVDIWAMGVIAYECLLGQRPFEGDTIGSVFLAICARPIPVPSRRGSVPPGFDEWFARVCARDPEARASSARAVASELRRICGVEMAPLSFASSEGPVSVAPRVDGSDPPFSAPPAERVPAQSVVGLSTSRRHEARRRTRRRASFFVVASLAALGVGIFGWVRTRASSLVTETPSSTVSATGAAPMSGGATTIAAAPTASAPAAPVSSNAEPIGAAPPVTAASAHTASATPAAPLRKGPAKSSRPASPKPSAAPAPTGHPKVNFGF